MKNQKELEKVIETIRKDNDGRIWIDTTTGVSISIRLEDGDIGIHPNYGKNPKINVFDDRLDFIIHPYKSVRTIKFVDKEEINLNELRGKME